MGTVAGVVLAGGRSSRMGTPKAALEWHGSTLARRIVGILARAADGPVIVVRAAGQELPELPPGTGVTTDPRPGRGPLQGIAAGLAAAARAGADVAFVSSVDLPFLHPAFVRRVLALLGDAEVALPVARGHRQPLAAAYRTSLAGPAERLVAAERLRPGFLYAERTVATVSESGLLSDPELARLDPRLDSLVNVNTPEDYERARRRPAPEVTVRVRGGVPATVRAATVRAAAEAVGESFAGAAVNGNGILIADGTFPLVPGDSVDIGNSPARAERPRLTR